MKPKQMIFATSVSAETKLLFLYLVQSNVWLEFGLYSIAWSKCSLKSNKHILTRNQYTEWIFVVQKEMLDIVHDPYCWSWMSWQFWNSNKVMMNFTELNSTFLMIYIIYVDRYFSWLIEIQYVEFIECTTFNILIVLSC